MSMNLLIPSQKKDLYSTRRLVGATLKQEHVAHVFNPLSMLLVLGKKRPAIVHQNLDQQIPRKEGYCQIDRSLCDQTRSKK